MLYYCDSDDEENHSERDYQDVDSVYEREINSKSAVVFSQDKDAFFQWSRDNSIVSITATSVLPENLLPIEKYLFSSINSVPTSFFENVSRKILPALENYFSEDLDDQSRDHTNHDLVQLFDNIYGSNEGMNSTTNIPYALISTARRIAGRAGNSSVKNFEKTAAYFQISRYCNENRTPKHTKAYNAFYITETPTFLSKLRMGNKSSSPLVGEGNSFLFLLTQNANNYDNESMKYARNLIDLASWSVLQHQQRHNVCMPVYQLITCGPKVNIRRCWWEEESGTATEPSYSSSLSLAQSSFPSTSTIMRMHSSELPELRSCTLNLFDQKDALYLLAIMVNIFSRLPELLHEAKLQSDAYSKSKNTTINKGKKVLVSSRQGNTRKGRNSVIGSAFNSCLPSCMTSRYPKGA